MEAPAPGQSNPLLPLTAGIILNRTVQRFSTSSHSMAADGSATFTVWKTGIGTIRSYCSMEPRGSDAALERNAPLPAPQESLTGLRTRASGIAQMGIVQTDSFTSAPRTGHGQLCIDPTRIPIPYSQVTRLPRFVRVRFPLPKVSHRTTVRFELVRNLSPVSWLP